MEYLSFIISTSSILAALIAAYLSRKNKLNMERKVKDFYVKKDAIQRNHDEKVKGLRL